MLRLSLPVQLLCHFFENFESDVNDPDSNNDVTGEEIKQNEPTDQPEDESNPGKENNAQKELVERTENEPEDDSEI